MSNIIYKTLKDDEIDICRDLCNELMAFQKEKAVVGKEQFDLMNYDTRMKVSYDSADKSNVVVAYDGDKPVGYVFSTVEYIKEKPKEPYVSLINDTTNSLTPAVLGSTSFIPFTGIFISFIKIIIKQMPINCKCLWQNKTLTLTVKNYIIYSTKR